MFKSLLTSFAKFIGLEIGSLMVSLPLLSAFVASVPETRKLMPEEVKEIFTLNPPNLASAIIGTVTGAFILRKTFSPPTRKYHLLDPHVVKFPNTSPDVKYGKQEVVDCRAESLDFINPTKDGINKIPSRMPAKESRFLRIITSLVVVSLVLVGISVRTLGEQCRS